MRGLRFHGLLQNHIYSAKQNGDGWYGKEPPGGKNAEDACVTMQIDLLSSLANIYRLLVRKMKLFAFSIE